MGKKTYWSIIIFSIVVNVVMLQKTIEAYLGREYETIFIFTIISLISSVYAIFAYIKWRKLEY